jgi:2,4-dienoyl-CoA reductase-like NADH-dependent reductase (Old Yellow Enzyme family)
LLLEVTESVREVWPNEFPLFVRISATDWTEGGWTSEDSVQLAKILKLKEVDLIDCSSGGNIPHAKIALGPGYQVPFAECIKKETGILTGAVGMIKTAEQAEEILSSGKADMVILAWQLLKDPYFPLHDAQQLCMDVTWPAQYNRAKKY